MRPSSFSTHVLDTARGRPVAGVPVRLEVRRGEDWVPAGSGRTDDDGRVAALAEGPLGPGRYRIVFELEAAPSVADGWYPEVAIVVQISDSDGHAHVPLLLSPFGYTTYRGS